MAKAELTDAELVEAVVSGDTERFGALMERYEAKLLRYATYLIHDDVLAQDVVQEAFIKTYKNLRGYNPRYKFSSWIYRIVHNEAISAVRGQRYAAEDVDIETLQEPSSELTTIRDIDRAILRGTMQACLDELDAKYREVLMLQYYENMQYDEIADVLHVPASTVGVWSLRGKAKLKKLCEEKGVTP